MATDRVSMDATSRAGALAPVSSGQGGTSARRTEAPAPAASEPSQTTVTLSPQAQDLAAQRANDSERSSERSSERAETTRTDEQAAVQQMSLINTQLRRTYGT